jgi:predicted GH43/DUF377 family glycosyl hydrolase
MSVHVTRLPIRLTPDPARVITRFFDPGEVNRVRDIVVRLMGIPAEEVVTLVAELGRDFSRRHADTNDVFLEHFEAVQPHIPDARALSRERRLLIGACFTMEYAIESAALFNPSIVPAVSQADIPKGSVRFLMSLRATGEGHVSSIVFRQGLIDAEGRVSVNPPGRYSRPLKAATRDEFDKGEFVRELQALDAWTDHTRGLLDLLGERFTRSQLSDAVDTCRSIHAVSGPREESIETLLAMAKSDYRLPLPPGTDVSEVVIFPFSDNERHGVEDLRLVRFTDDDGTSRYYGTYTAYNGYRIIPQLMEYRFGQDFEVRMLTGSCAKNKGMALFPRKIHGRYAMVARLDNENLYYMESEDVRVWDRARLFQVPRFPWEVIQIGNCGSPLETAAGWLLLTHGVGPMRRYCIGATLLDLDDPSRVIGQTSEPLLAPTDDERTGYVPNVVYSCGGMIHEGIVVLPYAVSDFAARIAIIDLKELLDSLAPNPA